MDDRSERAEALLAQAWRLIYRMYAVAAVQLSVLLFSVYETATSAQDQMFLILGASLAMAALTEIGLRMSDRCEEVVAEAQRLREDGE